MRGRGEWSDVARPRDQQQTHLIMGAFSLGTFSVSVRERESKELQEGLKRPLHSRICVVVSLI